MAGFDQLVATHVVVRVLGVSGEPVGTGFLLGPDLVATCAHVVADAAGDDPYATSAPERPVRIDFPMVHSEAAPAVEATVTRWVPIAADGSGDIAVLSLNGLAPAGARMPPLRRIDQLWDHPFRVLGFPDGLADGVWTTGRIRGQQATGWFQLQVAPGDQPIVAGFSGSPVWDDETGAVVGMTVATDATGETTTAYVIPIDQVFGADPELLPCPYRGLEPFDEEHAAFFFGRDDGIAQVEEVLASQALVAVAGPSGAGKSSLVRAGLLPRLRSAGVTVTEVRPLPGQPVDELISTVLSDPPADGRTIVLVDQFEELAAADPVAAQKLLVALGERLDAAGRRTDGSWPLQVVLTARSATLDEVVTPGIAARLGAGTVLVPPMDRGQLRDAIVAPAERAPGLTFEPGLVDRILDDAASEPGNLPLVESLLTELWEHRTGGILTIEAYQNSGGVAGVVATRAEDVVAALAVPPDDPALRSLFTALAGPDRDGRFVRRPLRTADIDSVLRPLVDRLVAGRLLVVERPPEGVERLQLAHQALIEHWPRLRGWLAEDRDFLTWRDQVDAQRDRWESAGRDDGGLLRGVTLAATADWLPRRAPDVPAAAREFVARSRARQRREVRRWRAVTAVLTVLVLAAGGLAAVAVARGNQVTHQLRLANAEVMAQAALARLPGDPVTASVLALAAHRSDPDNSAARTALARLAFGMQAVDAVHTDVTERPANVLVASEDGTTVLVRYAPNATVLTDALGAAPSRWSLPGLPPQENRQTLSGDGRTIAGLDSSGRVMLWDVARRTGPVVVSDGLGPALRGTLYFSPDQVRLSWLTQLPDGTRKLVAWDVRAGAPAPINIAPITDPQIREVTLTTDPGVVVEVRPTGATLRSVADGAVRATLPADGIAPGGSRYLVSCAPGAALIWDTATGQQLRRIPRLAADCTPTALQNELTSSGEFLMEQHSRVDDRDLDLWRITSLSTGKVYELLAPPQYADADMQQEFGRMPAVALVGDHLVVHLLRGRSVLTLHADPADAGRGARLTTGGQYELSLTSNGIAAIDPVTRASAGTLSLSAADSTRRKFSLNPDTVGALTRGPDHLSYSEYAVPGFAPTTNWVLPGSPGPEGSTPPGMDSLGDRVVALVGGVLSAWDRRTGQPVGAPVTLTTDAARARHFRISSSVWLRPGPAWQAAVNGPHGVELWDMTNGTQVAALESQPISVRFDGSGGRAAVVGQDLAVQVWDIERHQRVGAPFLTSTVTVVPGFTADGLLAIGVHPDQTVGYLLTLIDPETGRQRGSLRLPPNVEYAKDLTLDGQMSIFSDNGRRPSLFPMDAPRWTEQLCRLVDRPLTDAERALLPAGIDVERPCTA